MQTVLYMWRNLRRNKLRTTLTVLSVGFSLALLTVLNGYIAMQGVWGKQAEKYHRLATMNVQGFAGALPIAHVDKVQTIPGVVAATPYSWYGGNYKEEQMPFAQFGCDPKTAFKVWDEFTIDPQQLATWQDTRNGCVVDRRLAEKRGWKIGERIPLQGTFYQFNLDLVLCGVWDCPTNTDSLWFNWHYLNEGLKQKDARGADNAGMIFIKAANKEVIPQVAKAVDERFASSPNPTRTQTEAAFAQMFADMLGDYRTLIQYIGVAVASSLAFVTANAMAMSMRERTTEIAVLKAIGFSRRRVLATVLGESCSITVLGGIVGITLGCLFLQMLHIAVAQFFPMSVGDMAGPWLAYLLLVAFGIGLLSGIIPAILATQLSVIDGLRRVV